MKEIFQMFINYLQKIVEPSAADHSLIIRTGRKARKKRQETTVACSEIVWYNTDTDHLLRCGSKESEMTFDELMKAVLGYMDDQGMIDDLKEKYGGKDREEDEDG